MSDLAYAGIDICPRCHTAQVLLNDGDGPRCANRLACAERRADAAEQALRAFVEAEANAGGKSSDLVAFDLFRAWLCACDALGITPPERKASEV